MARIKVSVARIDGICSLPVQVGDHFFIEDSKLYVPEGMYVCIWALQRLEDEHWVKKVKNFSCPDPKGLVQFRLDVIE
jgi:uncharacterized repeat protein (TIGR04076 family)